MQHSFRAVDWLWVGIAQLNLKASGLVQHGGDDFNRPATRRSRFWMVRSYEGFDGWSMAIRLGNSNILQLIVHVL
jgi:hypothetical protein